MVRMGKACEDCARNCQLMHGNQMGLSPGVERFFKVMIGQNYSEVLFLPLKFAHTVKDLVDRETKLEDSNGIQWTVTVSSFDGSFAFQEGWHEFSVNHNLEIGDFLVFHYINEAHFVVHIFGSNCCEKENSGKSGPPCKRARTKGNLSARGKPCEKADTNATNRQGFSTSLNLKNIHNQSITTKSTPNSESSNAKWSCLDSSLYMIDRDAGHDTGEDRMCLFDLSSFEMQEGKQAANSKKGIHAEEGTSNQKQTCKSSQAEAGKNPIGTEETDIGMILNDTNLEPKDDMLVGCEKVLTADLSNSRPMGPSCTEHYKKRDNMTNVNIQLQNAERSNRNYGNDWSSPYADEGDIKKMGKKEQPQTREQERGRAKRLRGFRPSTIKERGSLPAALYVGKHVKLERVDSLDMASSVSDTVTCLAVTDGRHYLELPAQLPAITFKRGSVERKDVLLQDQKRRLWPALYYERSGLHILTGGWDQINRKNGFQTGDQYTFKVEDISLFIYKIDVLRQ